LLRGIYTPGRRCRARPKNNNRIFRTFLTVRDHHASGHNAEKLSWRIWNWPTYQDWKKTFVITDYSPLTLPPLLCLLMLPFRNFEYIYFIWIQCVQVSFISKKLLYFMILPDLFLLLPPFFGQISFLKRKGVYIFLFPHSWVCNCIQVTVILSNWAFSAIKHLFIKVYYLLETFMSIYSSPSKTMVQQDRSPPVINIRLHQQMHI